VLFEKKTAAIRKGAFWKHGLAVLYTTKRFKGNPREKTAKAHVEHTKKRL